jgi:hypothetical protein
LVKKNKMLRSKKLLFIPFIFCLFLFFHTTCKKEEIKRIIKVTTDDVSQITTKSATLNGTIVDIGEGITEHGFCWSTTNNPTIELTTKTQLGSKNSKNSFTSSLTNLTPNTTYYIKSYASDGEAVKYGKEKSFKTESQTLASITTGTVSELTDNSAKVTATINGMGNGIDSILQHGFCWSTTQNPTTEDNKTELGNKSYTGEFSSNLTDLSPSTTYYVRAYATNSIGTAYGNEISFTTSAILPTLTTSSVSDITYNSATSGGNITDDVGATLTARGVCWSTSQNPLISDNQTTDGNGTGSFSSSITGLSSVTTYYVRAYATNSVGTAYGNQIEFTTTEPILPIVTTISASSITYNSATSGGTVTDNGGATITARGVCWSTSQNPTVSDSHTTDGTGTGSFTSSITGLALVTTYYVRAYATNSAGTAYGNEIYFTTSAILPTVTTSSVSDITYNSAISGGNVTNDGGATVTTRGVCWSTSQNPTISNSHTTNGNGTGVFSSSITGLSSNTIYYVRAYAINSEGTSYGNEISLVTKQFTPSLQWQKCYGGSYTDRARSIIQTSDGGYAVAGYTDSNNGDVSGNHGGDDFWIIKLDQNGNFEWQKCFGGSDDEWAESIIQTIDGGYAIAGRTRSIDGDVSGLHGEGSVDYWIIKLDQSGNLEWQKCYGGSGYDVANSIIQTSDGGYAVAGYTSSNDGDVSGNHGEYDYWIIRLNQSGNIVWQKCYGGTSMDWQANSIIQTDNAGFLVAGASRSNDGDVSDNHGDDDIWIIKLTQFGDLEWQKSYGGSISDRSSSTIQIFDGSYVIAGYTWSNDGDVSGNHGIQYADYWIIKLDQGGNLIWQKCFGGAGSDWAHSIIQAPDGGYLVAGYTDLNDGDVSGNHGENDYWIIRLNQIGNLEWQKCFGGSNQDFASSIILTSDGSYIIAGQTRSIDGDVTGNHGSDDFWIIGIIE